MRKISLSFLAVAICQSTICQIAFKENQLDTEFPRVLNVRSSGITKGTDQLRPFLKELLGANEKSDFITIEDRTEFGESLRIQQFHQGIKVEFGILNAHYRSEKLTKISGNSLQISDFNIHPKLSENEALNTLLEYIGAENYAWNSPQYQEVIKSLEQNDIATFYPKGELVIFDKNLFHESPDPVLCYKFDVFAVSPFIRKDYYVQANTGEVIFENNTLSHSSGTAETRNLGLREIDTDQIPGGFRLRDYSRGSGIITYDVSTGTPTDLTDNDNNWRAAEFNNADNDNILLEAHWASMMFYDYFLQIHGRNSIDGSGRSLISYVNDPVIPTAVWNGSFASFGKDDIMPWATLDVVVHEFAHGLDDYTSNLLSSGEPGSIGEALSDIWGACVTEFAAPEQPVYVQGENAPFLALRDFNSPASSGVPSPNTYEAGIFWEEDYVPLHTNSTVMSLWFYLLSEGTSFGLRVNDLGNGFRLQDGIGIQKAAKILYHAQTEYFTPTTTFPQARLFTLEAADDLYGEDSREYAMVNNAWYGVGLGELIFGHLDGDDFACFNSNATIEITKFHPFESTVNWGVSPNLSIVSSNNDQVTVVASDPGFRGIGTITATYAGQQIVKEVWVGKPAFPSDGIFGSTSVPYGAIVNYSGSEVEGASSYQWLLPFPFDDPVFAYPSPYRWGIIDGGDGRHLTALAGPNNGLIQFKGVNVCGSGGAETLSVSIRTPGGGRTPNPGDPPVSEGDGIPFLDELDTDILLFPNPVRDNMTIRLSREDLKRISIFDLNGKLMLSKPIEGNELSLSIPREMKDGVYVLKINGETELVRKIILNRSGN